MTPKERLKRLESYSVCDNYREKEEDFREIEKALEVLDIITKNKKFIDVCYGASGNKIIVENYQFSVSAMQKEDFRKVKEWLRNAKWLFKRCIAWITKHLCRTKIEQRQKND